MQIIDQQGRLFGKVNLIDFLVFLFILCLMPLFYYGYKLIKSPPVSSTPTVVITKEEYKRLQKAEEQITEFLKEHKRLRKYFTE